jgi:hypothetical protein
LEARKRSCLAETTALDQSAWARSTEHRCRTALAPSSQTNIGTWPITLATSKYVAGTAPKSSTFTVVAAGAGIKVTCDVVSADGTAWHWGYTANDDGKDNPITGNCQYGDAVAITRVDASTTRNVYKQAGKVTITQNAVVSSDGKTMTITVTGTSPLGQAVNIVAVYDKQ